MKKKNPIKEIEVSYIWRRQRNIDFRDDSLMTLLRGWNKGSNITNTGNEEGDSLQEEEYEIAILSKSQIIAATEEEVCPNTKL